MPAPSPKLRELLSLLVTLASEDTVYRGESKCFDTISSGLYRQLYGINRPEFNITEAQQRQLEMARHYTTATDDNEILTTIQHFGGKTNLIDFTKDLNVALYFACDSLPFDDGRVIFFVEPQDDDYYTRIERASPSNMAAVQKSVLVMPKRGYIRDQDSFSVTITMELKEEILVHIYETYGIEQATVYNDITGFIRDQEYVSDYEAEWYKGLDCGLEGKFEEAVKHFTRCQILLWNQPDDKYWGSRMSIATYARGKALYSLGKLDEALEDYRLFQKVIPDHDMEIPKEILEMLENAKEEETQGNSPTPTFHIFAQDQSGTPCQVTARLASEAGFNRAQRVGSEGDANEIPVPRDAFDCPWFLWLNEDGYRGINGLKRNWPFSETFELPARDGDSLIRITIESRFYRGEQSHALRDGEWVPIDR